MVTPISVGTVMKKGLWSSLLASGLEEDPCELHPGIRVKASYTDFDQAAREIPSEELDVVLIAAASEHSGDELLLAASLRRSAPRLPLLVLLQSFEVALPQSELERLSNGCSFLHLETVTSRAALRQALVNAARGYEVVESAICFKAVPDTLDLTEHERTLLTLLREGYTNDAIARRVHLSPRTVESQVRSLYFKLKIDTADPNVYPRVRALEVG